jgi:hypothetical protein
MSNNCLVLEIFSKKTEIDPIYCIRIREEFESCQTTLLAKSRPSYW